MTQEPVCHYLAFDGLAAPNPGLVGAGAVLYSPDKKILVERGEYVSYGTNNQAEYLGLIIGLEVAIQKGIKNLIIQGDSMLVVKQVSGLWKVKDLKLQESHKKVKKLLESFTYFKINHVYRDNNKEADELTNEVARTKAGFYRECA